MDNLISYITDNTLILIPAIYVIGAILKGIELVKDKYIPVILLPIGIVLGMILIGFDVNGFIQGILVTGVAVYANQLVKQVKKEE